MWRRVVDLFTSLKLTIICLAAAMVLIFAGTEVLPGDLASAILQNSATPENLAEMRKELGLERPAVVRETLQKLAMRQRVHRLARQRTHRIAKRPI